MTGGSDTREKARAVFLAFVMVTSVFGATVALSGSAAATASNVDHEVPDAGGNFQDIDISVAGDTVRLEGDVGTEGNDLVFAVSEDGDTTINNGEVVAVVTDDSTPDNLNSNTVQVDGVNLTDSDDVAPGETGDHELLIFEESTSDGEVDSGTIGSAAEDSQGLTFNDVINPNEPAGDNGASALDNAVSAGTGFSGVSDGDTIIAGTGPNFNQVTLTDSKSLTLTGVAGGATITDSSGSDDVGALDLDDNSVDQNITVENFDITGSSAYNKNYGVIEATSLTGDTTNDDLQRITVRNSTITINDDSGENAFGIVLGEGGTVTAVNTTFESPGAGDSSATNDETAGIFAESAGDGAIVRDNTFDDNDFAVQLGGASDVLIENNDISQIDDEAIIINTEANANSFGTLDGASAIDNDVEAPTNVTIRSNTISTADDGVFFVDEDDDKTDPDFDDVLQVTNNDFTGINNFGVAVGDKGFNAGNDVTTVVNATLNFWGDSSGPSGIGPGSGAAVDDEVIYSQVDGLDTSLTFLDQANGNQVNTLDVSVNPSSAVRGESVTLSGTIEQGGSTFTSRAQFALIGLSNNQQGDTNIGPDVTSDADIETEVLATGSSTDGTFSISQTLNGAGDLGSDNNVRAVDEYYVVVRKGSNGFTQTSGDSSSDAGASLNSNINNVFVGDSEFPTTDPRTVSNIDGAVIFRAGPEGTVNASSTTRGTSVTIEGDISVSDGSGFANYPVDIRNADDDSNVKSITTNDAGSFATSEVLDDAATFEITAPLYNTTINNLDDSRVGTFDVSPNDQEVTAGVDTISPVTKSNVITLDAPGSTGNSENVTRFELSGVTLEEVDLNNDPNTDARIAKVTLSDGTEFGAVDSNENLVTNDGNYGSGRSEFSTATDQRVVIDSNSDATIESVVLLAAGNQDAGDEESLGVQVDAAESGTLIVEGQVETTSGGVDTSDTPSSPDFVGQDTITAGDPGELTVLLSPTNGEVDANDDGIIEDSDGDDTVDLDIQVLDADGNGLIDSNSHSAGEISRVDVNITGEATQFEADSGGNGQVILEPNNSPEEDSDATFTTGQNLDNIEFTVSEEGSTSDIDSTGDTDVFRVPDVHYEQNGTLNITVTANITGQSDDVTQSATYTVTDSDSVSGLPEGEFTVDEEFNVSATIEDGTGTPLNNRELTFTSDTDDAFKIDPDNDGNFEQTGVDAFRLSGSDGEAQFITTGGSFGNPGGNGDAQASLLVNDGQYELPNVNVTAPGATVDVQSTQPTNSGDIQANFPSQITTTGESVFTVESDVDPMVAGFEEQVNLTVTQNGDTINGTDLTDLLSNDASADVVSQEGSDLISDLTSSDAADTDGDNTVDAVQVDLTPQSTADINISIDNGDGTQTGTGSISVVEPEITVNQTGDFTERLTENVEISVVDPRDGSNLFDSDSTPNLRIRSLNGTTELAQVDGTAITEVDAGETLRNDAASGNHLANIGEGNQSATILPYREDGDSGPFTFEVSASLDANADGSGDIGDASEDYFGATNFTVGPQQVDVDPANITLGSPSTVQVVAEDANGNALGNQRVDLVGAGVSVRNAGTDSSGFVAVTVDPAATGTIGVHTASDASASIANDNENANVVSDVDATDDNAGDITTDPPAVRTQEATVNVTTEQNEFNVTVDPQTVTANESSTVTVTATNNASGDAVEGASVDLSGAGVNQSAQTDANGQATFDVNASQAGTIDVTVDDAGFTEATASITVQQPSEPVATVTFDDKTVPNGTEEITVESANFTRADGSAGDYVVVVHEVNATEFDGGVDNSISAPVGASENLSNGAENITVDLNSSANFEDGDALDSLTENVTLRAMLHTTDNESAFGTRLGVAIDGLERGDETDDANITVEEAAPEPADFTVSNVTPDGVNVTAGDNITVSADIENVGGQQATQSVEFRIVPADGNTSIDNASATATQNVTLDAGANDTVTFENVSTDGLATGDFTHGVFSANDSATATITLQEAADEQPVATVTFDDQTVPNGTEEVTVESANFTRADGSAGDYVVVVHVVNATDFDGGVDNSISAPVGASGDLTGAEENITVDLNRSAAFEDGDELDRLTENVTLRAMLHTTDNESAFGTRLGVAIDGLERGDETDDANITVEDQGLVDRFDENDNGEIELTEVQTAIRAFSNDDLTLTEIQTLIREFAGE